MSNQDQRSFDNERDKQLEVLRKIVAFSEETFKSLNLVAKVQTSKQTLALAYRDCVRDGRCNEEACRGLNNEIPRDRKWGY